MRKPEPIRAIEASSAKRIAEKSGADKTQKKRNSHDEGGLVLIGPRLRGKVQANPNEGLRKKGASAICQLKQIASVD